jgi:RimJ/RimL family protein N-acetyltransferase
LGYLVHRKHWGKGYATEALKALLAWLGSCPPFERAWASCDADNAASIRVLEKAGFKREGTLPRYALRPMLGTEPRDACLYALALHG